MRRRSIVLLAMLVCATAAAADERSIREASATGRDREAIAAAWDALRDARAQSGARSLASVQALELLVDVLPSAEDAPTDSLDAWLLQAQGVRERTHGAHAPELVPILRRRATFVRRSGDRPTAAQLLERAAAIAASAPELDADERIRLLLAQGDLAYDMGRLESAQKLYEQAMESAQALAPAEPQELAECDLKLAYVARRAQRLPEAYRHIESAIVRTERVHGDRSRHLATALNFRAILHRQSDRLAEAIDDNERAAQINRWALGEDHAFVAGNLNNLGNLLHDVGDLRRAEAALLESLRIRERILGPEHPALAQSFLNIGNVAYERGDYDAAIRALERSLAIQRKSGSDDAALRVSALSTLGAAYSDLGRGADAQRVLDEAIAIAEASAGPESPVLIVPLFNRSIVAREAGEFELAAQLTQRGLELEQSYFDPESPSLVRGLCHAASLHYRQGDHRAAIATGLRAERLARRALAWTAESLSETTARLAADARDSGLSIALHAAVAAGDRAQFAAVAAEAFRSRGVVLDHAMRRRQRLHAQAGSELQAAIAAVDEAHGAWLRHAERAAGPGGQEAHRARAAELMEEVRVAELALARLDRVAAATGSELGLTEVQAALGPRDLLLSYWYLLPHRGAQDPNGSYFAILTRRDDVRVVSLGRADAIDRDIALWRESLRAMPGRDAKAAEALARERGERVRAQIWDPLAAEWSRAERVFVVPDAQLHFVAFAALPGDDGYLIESGPMLHLLTSERDLLDEAAQRPVAHERLVVVGGADFDRVAAPDRGAAVALSARTRGIGDCTSLRDLRFEALPASDVEAQAISDEWNSADSSQPIVLLRGAAADETSVRAELAQAHFAHIATHGFYLGGECAPSEARLRGVGGVAPSWESDGHVADSFRLSGLALAGANHRASAGSATTDGILTAEEIAGLDLRGLECAVLSACDTGLGDLVRAEGVYGLRRAFRIAGARSVVSSLWAVEDEATREWMRAFYGQRDSGSLSISDAVIATHRDVLGQRRREGRSTHPFYWASFQACGRP